MQPRFLLNLFLLLRNLIINDDIQALIIFYGYMRPTRCQAKAATSDVFHLISNHDSEYYVYKHSKRVPHASYNIFLFESSIFAALAQANYTAPGLSRKAKVLLHHNLIFEMYTADGNDNN